MIEKTITVSMSKKDENNRIAILVQIASRYESKIHLLSDDKKINAKSIMGTMSMGFFDGQVITITADGPDAETAVDEIANYLTSNH